MLGQRYNCGLSGISTVALADVGTSSVDDLIFGIGVAVRKFMHVNCTVASTGFYRGGCGVNDPPGTRLCTKGMHPQRLSLSSLS